jgi:aminoglycoside 2''-phosphotransferase
MNHTKIELLQLIGKNIPDLTWKSARLVATGFDHDVIILDNQTVFRFPKKRDSKLLLKGEIGLLRILTERLSIAVPNYHFVSKDYTCTAYSMIEGIELNRRNFSKLSEGQQHQLARQMAKFLSELHSVNLNDISHFKVRERYTAKELRVLHKDAEKKLRSVLPAKDWGALEEYFFTLAEIFSQTPNKVLVHGDFSGDNMVIGCDGKLTGVIDFADRAIYDPAFDFLFLWEYGQGFVETVLKYYRGNKDGLLRRSKAFAQASAIWNMMHSLKESKPGFKTWHQKFIKLACTPC